MIKTNYEEIIERFNDEIKTYENIAKTSALNAIVGNINERENERHTAELWYNKIIVMQSAIKIVENIRDKNS